MTGGAQQEACLQLKAGLQHLLPALSEWAPTCSRMTCKMRIGVLVCCEKLLIDLYELQHNRQEAPLSNFLSNKHRADS